MDAATRQLVRERAGNRGQPWDEHFEWRGIVLEGKSAIGRATIEVLDMNSEDRLELRIVSGE
jgi:hypothetical protein